MSHKALSTVNRPSQKGPGRQRGGTIALAAARRPLEYKKYVHNSDLKLRAFRPSSPETVETDILQSICDHCIQFIDTTAAFLSKMTEREVSLSVKFLWSVEGKSIPALHTLFRSTNTRLTREVYAPNDNYSYMENTAFRTLLEERPRKHHYASDDLVADLMAGKYENSNNSWISFYTATCVVTIPCSKTTEALPIGFLCADSYLGIMSSVPVRETLDSASIHLYNVLSVLFAGYSAPASERVAAIHSKQSAEIELLPCGWEHSDGQLVPLDSSRQQAFQKSLSGIEDIYRKHSTLAGEARRVAPGQPDARYAPPLTEEAGMGYDREALRARAINSSSPAAKRWLAMRAQGELTPEQQDEVIRKLESYNPEAAAIVRGQKA